MKITKQLITAQKKEFDTDVKVSKIANTNMDKAVRKKKEQDDFGKFDLSIFLQEEPKPKETLYLYETDKILAERNKKYIN